MCVFYKHTGMIISCINSVLWWSSWVMMKLWIRFMELNHIYLLCKYSQFPVWFFFSWLVHISWKQNSLNSFKMNDIIGDGKNCQWNGLNNIRDEIDLLLKLLTQAQNFNSVLIQSKFPWTFVGFLLADVMKNESLAT